MRSRRWYTAVVFLFGATSLLLGFNSGSHHAATSASTTTSPQKASRPLGPLPLSCLDDGALTVANDVACYMSQARAVEAALVEDPRSPYCWGRGGQSPLLVQTAALTTLPPGFALFLHSFLATQCCDAVLWLWVPAHLKDGVEAFVRHFVPPLAAHRVVVKELSLSIEWAGIAGDFPGVPATAVVQASTWKDLRFVSDFYRLVLMYSHGGVWFDIDTVFLRDLTPLLASQAHFNLTGGWWYRAGGNRLGNNAAMRLAQRPNAMSHSLLAYVLQRPDHSAQPGAIFDWLLAVKHGVGVPGVNTRAFAFLSQTLFDVMWLRHDQTMAMHDGSFVPIPFGELGGLHLELNRNHPHTEKRSSAWYGFFTAAHSGTTTPTLAAVRTSPFFPGSFTYHWHNRYDLGVGVEGSWARVLHDRFADMAKEKVQAGECRG